MTKIFHSIALLALLLAATGVHGVNYTQTMTIPVNSSVGTPSPPVQTPAFVPPPVDVNYTHSMSMPANSSVGTPSPPVQTPAFVPPPVDVNYTHSMSMPANSSGATPAPPVQTPGPNMTTLPPNTGPGCTLQFPGRNVPHVAISGTSITVPVETVSGCATASIYHVQLVDPNAPPATGYDSANRVGYSWRHRHQIRDSRNLNAGGGSINFGGAVSTAQVTITPYCGLNDTTFEVRMVETATDVATVVGTLNCVHAFPSAPSAASRPTKINVWISTVDATVLANTLLAAWSNWNPTVGASLAGNAQLSGDSDFGTAVLSFNSFQSAANLLVDGTTAVSDCDGFSTSTFSFGTNTGLFIVGGAYQRAASPSCATTNGATAIASLIFTMTDVIVADASTDPAALTAAATQTVTLGYPDSSGLAVRKTLEEYAIRRFERSATVCAGSALGLTTIPAAGTVVKAKMLEARRFYFNGVCGITECCIGHLCSNEVHADGRSCILPRVTTYGTKVGVTLKKADGTSFYVNVYLSYEYGSELWGTSSSYYENLHDNAAGTQVLFYRRTSQHNYCIQLSCIPNANSFEGITPYSNLVCPQASDWTLPGWMRRNPSYAAYALYYVWTYYLYTPYGWAKSVSNGQKEYIATFTRSTTAAACGCAAIGLTTYPVTDMTFPASSRKFDGSGYDSAATKHITQNFQLSRLPPVASQASNTLKKAFCTCWSQRDAANALVTQRLSVATSCFKCPASIEQNTVLPRGFWRIRSWGASWRNGRSGEVGNSNQVCFRAFGNWQRGRVPWARRCCYKRPSGNSVNNAGGNTTTGGGTANNNWPLTYIPRYPSTLRVSAGFGSWPDYNTERLFSYTADQNPEQVCCRHGAGMGSRGKLCRMYRDRRPVDMATTSPFVRPRGCSATWTPMPPRGWGRGDPYCTTMDGAGFECNFWGEALWTSCQGWKVHTAAEPVSENSKATIVVAVAVAEGNETVVIQRNNETGDSEFRVNGELHDEEYTGTYLSVTLDETSNNLTIIRVTSIAGEHEAEVETLTASLTLSVAPDASCLGTCSGLMGNCDGDAANDIKSLDGTVSLPSTASGTAIFSNIVVSYLINNTANSLFDYDVSVPPAATAFTPNFVTASTLASCPSTCNNDPGCCLDNEIAGPAFAAETVATVSTIEEAKNSSVPLTGYNWPPSVTMNPNVGVLDGLSITQKISAYDTDGVSTLTIDACTDADVTCTRETTSAATTSTYTLTTTATRNLTVTVTAVDTKGATTISYMAIESLPPPPLPATSVAFLMTVPGSTFTPANVYEARLYLAGDLAAIVNTYWNATTTGTAPAYTVASDFTISAVSSVSTGVQVNIYIAGDTLAEASARLSALNSQTSLTLTETLSALGQLTATAPTSGTGTAATTTVATTAAATTAAASSDTFSATGTFTGSGASAPVGLLLAAVATFFVTLF